jgi:hypothetical protein
MADDWQMKGKENKTSTVAQGKPTTRAKSKATQTPFMVEYL